MTLLTLAAVVALFVLNRWPVEVVAVGSALTLYGLGVLTLSEALAGFGDPAVILIAALFVVSEGLDATGVTTWVGQGPGQQVRHRAGPAAAAHHAAQCRPHLADRAQRCRGGAAPDGVIVMALRRSVQPSRLLMPLAFAGSAGGLLLLTGSPVNVVISEAAEESGVGTSGSPSSRSSAYRSSWGRSRSSCSSVTGCSRTGSVTPRRRTSVGTPARWCATTRSTTCCTSG